MSSLPPMRKQPSSPLPLSGSSTSSRQRLVPGAVSKQRPQLAKRTIRSYDCVDEQDYRETETYPIETMGPPVVTLSKGGFASKEDMLQHLLVSMAQSQMMSALTGLDPSAL